MSISSLIRRPAIAAAALMALSVSAHANLTIPSNALVADSVQAFSDIALAAFDAGGVTVTPLGNATNPKAGSYSFPITSITIGSNLKIAKGDAKGSALQLSRVAKGFGEVSVVIANFTLDYNAKKVLADTTPKGGTTTKQMPIYNFSVGTALGFKYKFPLTITAHEVLDHLTATDELKASMKDGLKLTPALVAALEGIDTFGSLTQDILVNFRPKPVSTTPYVPAP